MNNEPFRLIACDPVVFVPVTDAQKAREFYGARLGLPLLREDLPFALVYGANGIMLRLSITPGHKPAQGTIAGWRVDKIDAAVTFLRDLGIEMERFGLPNQDEAGIWTAPTGARVAWFKDPDGNLLSVSEHPELAGKAAR